MLVSSAMLALIIVGLTAMFIQVQKAFKTGIKQTDVGDTGLTITRLIASDLSQMSDGQRYNTNVFLAGFSNLVNFSWNWGTSNNQELVEDGVVFRTNQLQNLYILVHTNTGWTGIGYVVSNYNNIGGGTLYRYVSPVNAHYFNNHTLFDPFLETFSLNFSNKAYSINPAIRLSRIADGIVHLKVRVYDSLGHQVGIETNYGDFYNRGPIYNGYPIGYPLTGTPVLTNYLPSSVDLELGILDPDAWEHFKSLSSTPAAQATYLASVSGKMNIFHQRILVRAATP